MWHPAVSAGSWELPQIYCGNIGGVWNPAVVWWMSKFKCMKFWICVTTDTVRLNLIIFKLTPVALKNYFFSFFLACFLPFFLPSFLHCPSLFFLFSIFLSVPLPLSLERVNTDSQLVPPPPLPSPPSPPIPPPPPHSTLQLSDRKQEATLLRPRWMRSKRSFCVNVLIVLCSCEDVEACVRYC